MESKEIAKIKKVVKCIDSCETITHTTTCYTLIRLLFSQPYFKHNDALIATIFLQVDLKIKAIQNDKAKRRADRG